MEKLIRWFRHNWPLMGITLVGAGLRFYHLASGLQFLGDQGRDALIWLKIWTEFDLPFIGPITSVGGFFLGPLYYYLTAPFFFLFGNNPLGPVYFTALAGTITVPILFMVTRRLFSVSAAYWTAGLYALAAIPVSETRSAWNPNLMPLTALGIVWGFYQAQQTNKKTWLYFSAFCLGLALQLHYMIVFFGLFLLWQLVAVWKNRQLRPGLINWLGILIALMLPLILFEIKNRWLNTAGLISYLTQHHYSQFSLSDNFKNLIGRSEETIGMILGFGRQTNLLRTIITRLALLATFIVWLKKPSREFKLISLWVVLTIIGVAVYKDNVPPYYLGFVFPAVFMLVGYLLAKFSGKLKLIAIIFTGIFVYYNVSLLVEILASRGNLRSVEKTSAFIKNDIEAQQYKNYNLVLLDGTRDYKAMAFRFFLEKFGAKPLGIADYPQTQVLYVISPYIQVEVLKEPIWEITSILPATVSASWQFPDSENIYKIEKL